MQISSAGIPDVPTLEAALDAVVDNLALIGQDYTILLANQTAARYFGKSKAELVGRKCHEMFQDSCVPCAECPVEITFRTGQPCLQAKHAAPTDSWLEIATTPVFDQNGNILGVIEHAKDVSAKQKLQAAAVERERLVAELAAAVKAKDSFLAVAAHELRSPLTTLQLQLEQLSREVSLLPVAPNTCDRRVAMSLRQARKLRELVEQLLDVSRISSGRLDLHLEEVDLVAETRDVLTDLNEELVRSGSAISIESPARLSGRWDRSRI